MGGNMRYILNDKVYDTEKNDIYCEGEKMV